MNHRKIFYAAAILIGLGVAAAFRYARYNDVDVPMWAFIVALPVPVALIALDIWMRRRHSKRADDDPPQDRPRDRW